MDGYLPSTSPGAILPVLFVRGVVQPCFLSLFMPLPLLGCLGALGSPCRLSKLPLRRPPPFSCAHSPRNRYSAPKYKYSLHRFLRPGLWLWRSDPRTSYPSSILLQSPQLLLEPLPLSYLSYLSRPSHLSINPETPPHHNHHVTLSTAIMGKKAVHFGAGNIGMLFSQI